jgi:hypothetical protein
LSAKQEGRKAAAPAGIALFEGLDAAPGWKRAVCVAAVLIVVLCILVPDLIFENRIFLSPDVQAPLGFATVGNEALEAGVYPLWNPYLFCGMPSYASLAYTPYVYAPSFVTYLLQHYLHFPEMTWLLAHYLFAGVGVYFLARSLGARAIVSIIAAMTFMVMPNYVANGAYGHGSQACSTAYMPWAMLLAWNIMKGVRRRSTAALLAIVLGFQMLRGHLQIAFYTYLLIGILFVFESIRLLRARAGRAAALDLAAIAAAFAGAVGIAAVLLVPVHEYAALSIRGGGGAGGGLEYSYATNWSLHPKEMLTFIFPSAFGFGKMTYWGSLNFTDYPNYLGLVTVVFAAFAIALAPGASIWLLVVVAAFATLLSFGKFFPVLYGPMFKLFPYFNKFRVPVMVLIVQQLALSGLMAVGLEAYLRRAAERSLPDWLQPKKARWALVGAVAALVIAALASGAIRGAVEGSAAVRSRVPADWLNRAGSLFASDLVRTLFIATLIALVLYLASVRRVLAGTLALVFGVIALIDLVTIDRKIVHPETAWPGASGVVERKSARDEYLQPDDLIRFFEADSTYYRIFPTPNAPLGQWSYSTPPFNENRFMIFKISSIGGYHAAKLKIYQNVMDRMFESLNRGVLPVGLLDMLNTKYIMSYHPLFKEGSGFPVAWNRGDVYVYRNPGALPRVFLVNRYRVMPRAEALSFIVSSDFDPGREAILEAPPSPAPDTAATGSAEIVQYGYNDIAARARCDRPAILVMSEIVCPGWTALVDGKETPIRAADYCLRALPLTAGDHEIRMRYSSPALVPSLALSVVVFLAALAIPVADGIAARRRRV